MFQFYYCKQQQCGQNLIEKNDSVRDVTLTACVKTCCGAIDHLLSDVDHMWLIAGGEEER